MASIKRRPDGAWRARYRDESGRERSRHFGRKVDAQAWLDEVTASIVTGQYVAPDAGKVTFSQFYEEWAARQVWVVTTEISVSLAVRSVEFADTPIRSIRRSHIETWVKQQVARGLAPGTIHTRFASVRSVFRAAVRDRRIAIDPCEGVALPRVRRAESAMRLPLPAEISDLIFAAGDHYLATMIYLGAFAGLRSGEMCGVQLGDIDFLGRSLTVARQVQRAVRGGEVRISPPKYGSERTVYLPDDLVTVLAGHVAQYEISGPTSWLFRAPGGGPVHGNTIAKPWSRMRSRAGLDDVTMHDLRHFYASGLIAEGCDVVTVQRALGHRSASTTLDVYSHLWPTAEDRTRRAAGVMFMAVTGSAADSPRTSGGM